jgi:hypothetical protein
VQSKVDDAAFDVGKLLVSSVENVNICGDTLDNEEFTGKFLKFRVQNNTC